jgi:hypothetical protein
MEPGGSMPHSQELSNNPYPEPNIWYFKSRIRKHCMCSMKHCNTFENFNKTDGFKIAKFHITLFQHCTFKISVMHAQ